MKKHIFNILTGLTLTAGVMFIFTAGRASAQVFTNLHTLAFTDGSTPYGGLTLIGNTLYGTAEKEGGASGESGSVFKMGMDGSGFANMHAFTQGTDGGNPYGGVVLAGGMLYGTDLFGGPTNYGCIFAINTNGSGFTVPYCFPPLENHSPFDTNQTGCYPNSTLAVAGGTLYGATSDGGFYSWGTLFSVNTNGLGFVNLHNFDVTNGQYPNAVTVAGNVLFGTASDGGTYQNGIIFMINTNGSGFTNLYNFSGAVGYPYTNSDGASPVGSLVVAGNTLYGVTTSGGPGACGVVYSISTNGTGYTVLHQFSATNAAGFNADGAHPSGGLLLWSNTLYGVALDGGTAGAGTVFSVGTDGSRFKTLHNFSSINNASATNSDGATPRGDLILSGSVLYGTASAGGTNGYGTIFSILFPPPLYVAHAGTNCVVTWPTNVIGFNLESTTNLAAPVWTAVGGQYAVTNTVTGKQKFFRLVHP